MADAISAEEQRQIDAAIALSLGQEPASEPSNTPATSTDNNVSRQVISIEDSSSEDEQLQATGGVTAGSAVRTSMPISLRDDDHNDESASVDSSATELSDDERNVGKTTSNGKKRKFSSQAAEEISLEKKPKHDLPSSSEASCMYTLQSIYESWCHH